MHLNYPGDLTGTELVGERGLFPYITRDGGARDRVLEVTSVDYLPVLHRTVVEFLEVAEPA